MAATLTPLCKCPFTLTSWTEYLIATCGFNHKALFCRDTSVISCSGEKTKKKDLFLTPIYGRDSAGVASNVNCWMGFLLRFFFLPRKISKPDDIEKVEWKAVIRMPCHDGSCRWHFFETELLLLPDVIPFVFWIILNVYLRVAMGGVSHNRIHDDHAHDTSIYWGLLSFPWQFGSFYMPSYPLSQPAASDSNTAMACRFKKQDWRGLTFSNFQKKIRWK